MYAIVDIETTGGKYNEEGITEVAIYKFDGHEIVDQFISLVNPEKDIQEFVVRLTGINNGMLRNAPKFYEIAKRIIEITEDCTIVAHNASFDYRILKMEFDRLGYDFQRNTLCTVELSQELIKDETSYSLGKLTKSLGIPMANRHRASGDALATVHLFKILLEKDIQKSIINKAIKYFDKKYEKEKLKKMIEEMPESLGVFYIHDANGTVIFMAKHKNMKSELNRVLMKTTKRAIKVQTKAQSISYDTFGTEILVRLKYYLELDNLSPKYNFKKKFKLQVDDFNHPDFLIIDKGRMVEEHGIILVENNEIVGFGHTNLAFQEQQLPILRKIVTPIENKSLAKHLVKSYLNKNRVSKIVRF
ncbi:ribonuclease H-like domain-containing protein [Polaribacter sp. BAL334]|uniref:exonuclease domain-containing protein n=1 Tax=Polaribacter sp. BAL334 TaxID=1708178 RepID=UPI0018D212EE|nr:exonuclease domain-containing protein [Polaribacter sp. BAL334]MBG7612921.1 ribonuclease H-like domain-containing protein [Polaribacter sp. BAL334]